MSTRQEMHWEHIRQNQLMRNVRKEIVRNRESDRVRRKDWQPGDLEDPDSWDEIESPQYERVMPRGEQERRRNNLKRAQVRTLPGEEPADVDDMGTDAASTGGDWRDLLAAELPRLQPAGQPNANGSTNGHEGTQSAVAAGPNTNGHGGAQNAVPSGTNTNESTKGHEGTSSVASLHPGNGANGATAAGTAGARYGMNHAANSPTSPAPTRPGLAKPGLAKPGVTKPGLKWVASAGSVAPDGRHSPGQAADVPAADVPAADMPSAAAAGPAYPRAVRPPASGRSPGAEPLPPGYGLVVEAGSGMYRVEVGGKVLLCTLRGNLMGGESGLTNVLAAGDRVRVTAADGGRGVVEAVQPRRTALARPDVFNSHLRQVLAANVDQLLAVAAYENPPLWPELIDRYLITAELNGLAALICLNKVDLAEDMAEARAAVAAYLALGYPVIFTSAQTGYGIDALHAALAGRATVLAGLSGVGKSSLLSAVQPGLNLRVLEVNEHQRLGRHTTTGATLHRLTSGGFVVDTPGIKEWGLSGLGRRELGAYYPEIAGLAGRCRFDDCSHLEEPGCAIKAAVRSGRMAQTRYDNYRKIYVTLRE